MNHESPSRQCDWNFHAQWVGAAGGQLRMELSMSKTDTVSPLRQRMIEDMAARKLNPHTQRSHI